MGTLTQPHSLTWGALNLDARIPDADEAWLIQTLAEGSSLGNPKPLVETVRSWLDGEAKIVTSHENREVTFRVRIVAPNGVSLAQAEAAFMAEVQADRPSPLVWTSPMFDAWPAAFDVVQVTLDGDYSDGWDHKEKYLARAYYRLTFDCLPWVRDLESTTIPAIPAPVNPDAPASFVDIDTCDATTGWAITFVTPGWSSPSLNAGTGYLAGSATLAVGRSSGTLALTRTGAVDMLGMPYLYADAPSGVVYYATYDATGFGVPYYPIAATSAPDAGNTRYIYEAPAAFGAVRFSRRVTKSASVAGGYGVYIAEVGATDRVGVSGSSGFQIARTALVGGSAPTEAAITLSAGADPLVGSTALIYTGASPVIPLRNQITTSATVVVDDTMISGGTNDLSSPTVCRIPVAQLSDATYSLLARLSFTGSKTINWSARIVDSAGAAIPGSELVVSGSALVTNSTADLWKIHTLAEIQLPPVAIESEEGAETTHAVEVTLSMTSGGNTVLVDEGWLADTEHGAVTVIHEPSAFQLSEIELRSERLDAPHPAAFGTWVGYGTQDITRLVTAFGVHRYKPGLLHVFTATDLAKYAECSLTYYRRYHTRPGPDPEAAE